LTICRYIIKITCARGDIELETAKAFIVKGGTRHILVLGSISFEEIPFLLGLFSLGGWLCLPFRIGVLVLSVNDRY
jgi:hypothetical protein